MPYALPKALFGTLLLLSVLFSTPSDRRPSPGPANPPDQSRTGSANNLPTGVEPSDWEGILAAHEEWKHAIRQAKEGRPRWEGLNPWTGLRATFDARGGEMRPESDAWQWGLELLRYGVGREQRSVAGHRPRVVAEGRRIGYDWDGNLEEWYQNRAGGMEHGYTIQERPGGRGETAPLELSVRVRGGLREVAIIDAGLGATFGREKGEALIHYRGLKVLDADGREVAARLEAAERGELRLLVEDQTAIYPLTIDPTISQQAYLKASNTGAGDEFGYAVAISGDTVVIGAPHEDSNAVGINGNQADNSAENSGAVYVFIRNGLNWSQQAYIKASNTDIWDLFGTSVAIHEDTLIVGAPMEDSVATGVNGDQANNNLLSSGSAYVFFRQDGIWSQQAYLKASNSDGGDWFGVSVAIHGETIVVGAHYEDSSTRGVNSNHNNSLSDAGAAYVFVRNGTLWSQQAYLKASNTNASSTYAFEGDWFGYAVAISKDTVVVGARLEDNFTSGVNGNEFNVNSPGNKSGACYIFVRNGSTWSQEAYVKASNPGNFDQFGYSVSISGDRLVVGAPEEDSRHVGVNANQLDNSAQRAGAAYVFVRNGTTWAQQAYLKASNTDALDWFGFSVAISGEIIVIGAPFESSSATGVNGNQSDNSKIKSGAAYVFVWDGRSWSQQAYLKASNTGESDYLGRSVAISNQTLIVGANGEDCNATGVNALQLNTSANLSGAAYVFESHRLSITTQPFGGVSGGPLAIQPVVAIQNAMGNTITSSTVPVSVTIQSGNGGTLGGTTTVEAVNGIATFSNITLKGLIGENYVLRFTSPGLLYAESNSVTVNLKLGFTTQPVGGVARGLLPIQPVVAVQDWLGEIDVNSSAPVTVAIQSGAGGALGGTTTVEAVSGVATFSNLTLSGVVGVAYVLRFTSPGLLQVDSDAVTVTLRLALTTQPVGRINGELLSIQPVVMIQDAVGNTDSGSSAPVTITIQSGSGGTLGGTRTVNAVNGVAAFSNLTLTGIVGEGYVLRFTSPGLMIVDSNRVTVSSPVVNGGTSVSTPDGETIGPGSRVTITQILTNIASTDVTTTFEATLPAGLRGLFCSSSIGTCGFGTGSVAMTWAGTIPAQSSVTITYHVQVSAQATGGTQYCVSSTIGGLVGPSTCWTVVLSPSGPGNLPVAGRMPSHQKPGSVLIFNVYTSSINTAISDTLVSLTNTDPTRSANIYLFFVDGVNGAVVDQMVILKRNHTTSFLVSDIDPGVTGYLLAITVGTDGCPMVGNFLIGTGVVRFETGHHAALPAMGISALGGGAPCLPGSLTATLAFDGMAYDELPRGIAVTSLPSLAAGNQLMLVINRIGGDLTQRGEPLASLSGVLFEDTELSVGFQLLGGSAQVRGILGNNFPRTLPRFTTVIPAGRTGWMKFWADRNEAITGVLINEAPSGLSGGYNLQTLTTTNGATLTIPVIPVT